MTTSDQVAKMWAPLGFLGVTKRESTDSEEPGK